MLSFTMATEKETIVNSEIWHPGDSEEVVRAFSFSVGVALSQELIQLLFQFK